MADITRLEPTLDSRCGIYAGFRAHQKRGEKSCPPCSSARKVYMKKYMLENPGRAKELKQRWRDANREKVREMNSRWDKANPKSNRKASRKWKENNQARVKENHRLWYIKNCDRQKETARLWNLANSDIVRAAARRRRARKKGNGHEPYTEAQVLELYGTDCHICLKPIDLTASRRVGIGNWQVGLHIEHVTAIFLGGPDTLANVKPSHGLCNLQKGH